MEALSRRRAFALNFVRHIPETLEFRGRPVHRGVRSGSYLSGARSRATLTANVGGLSRLGSASRQTGQLPMYEAGHVVQGSAAYVFGGWAAIGQLLFAEIVALAQWSPWHRPFQEGVCGHKIVSLWFFKLLWENHLYYRS